MSAAKVVLWRHGRTAYNHVRRFQGQRDIPLDDVGAAQAEVAAAALAARLAGTEPVRLITSDLSRAWMTADALARRLGVVAERDPALREIAAGAWEGLSSEEIDLRWAADHAAWRRGEDIRVGGGETRSEAARRTADAVQAGVAGMATGALVVVSHGASLRGALALLLGAPAPDGAPEAGWRNPFAVLRNAHWAELEVMPGPWRLVAYNVGVMDAPADEEPGDTADQEEGEGQQASDEAPAASADGAPGRGFGARGRCRGRLAGP